MYKGIGELLCVCVHTYRRRVRVCVCGVHGCGIERLLLLPIHSCWCESWPKVLHVRVLLFVVTLPNLGVGFTSPSSGGSCCYRASCSSSSCLRSGVDTNTIERIV